MSTWICDVCFDGDVEPEEGTTARCPVALSARGKPKISIMTEQDAIEAAEAMRADGYLLADYYPCSANLVCENVILGVGCGRQFPGTEHWHVTSGGIWEEPAGLADPDGDGEAS